MKAVTTIPPDPDAPFVISMCTSQPCFNEKGAFTPDPAPLLCHELIHVLQYSPHCNATPADPEKCLDVFAAEMEAHYCTGDCRRGSGCFRTVLGRLPPLCAQAGEPTGEQQQSLIEWLDQLIANGNVCPGGINTR